MYMHPGLPQKGLSMSQASGALHTPLLWEGPMDGVVEGVAQEARASRSVIGKFLLD
jgi:hypothetical protein